MGLSSDERMEVGEFVCFCVDHGMLCYAISWLCYPLIHLHRIYLAGTPKQCQVSALTPFSPYPSPDPSPPPSRPRPVFGHGCFPCVRACFLAPSLTRLLAYLLIADALDDADAYSGPASEVFLFFFSFFLSWLLRDLLWESCVFGEGVG